MPMFGELLRRNGALAAGALAVFLLVRPPVVATAQRPTFRTESEAVWVTATVIDRDRRLVTDLTKDDFEVLDNGFARDITVFRNDSVPFAITVLFDVSGSLVSNGSTMRQAVNELIARFQTGDRAAIGAFWAVAEISPRFSANAKTLLGWVNATAIGVGTPCVSSMTSDAKVAAPRSFGTAVWSAIRCGIDTVSKDAETPRRVVLVITDGLDNSSILTSQEVAAYAERFGVMVYAIGMSGVEGLDESPLRKLAQDTGGGYYRLTARDDLPRTFARIAEELRHQYVFGFTPSDGGGAHNLEVRVKRADVIARARRVYMEAMPGVTVPPAMAPAAPVDSKPAPIVGDPTGAALNALDRYERGGPASRPRTFESVQGFSSSFEGLRKIAPAWIGADPAQQAQRRLAIATYVLDLINANPDVVADGPVMRGADAALREQFRNNPMAIVSPSASDVIEWACSVLREGPPLPIERTWHAAAIAALERFRGQSALDSHVAHAESRFPKDPEWALARAVAQESQTWPDRRDETDYRPPSGLAASRTAARFEEAAAFPETRQEALLRWGYFELRRGRAAEALTHFAAAGESDDVVLRYWLHLFKGRALERSGRLEDAIAAYRLAASDVPYAQSATTALAVALVANHQADEAAALMNRMLSVRPPLDPWNFYAFPATRSWQALMSQLHEAVKR